MSAEPVWFVTYENVDISDELAPQIVSAEYRDHLQGKSDELNLSLEDRAGRWREGWFPASGDRIAVRMGYRGAPLLDAGRFAVDQVELRGGPDAVTISALAAPPTAALRGTQQRAFEETTLRQIVARVARELELTVVGEVADVSLGRVTQSGETTLAFLRRLCEGYGYAFSVRPPQLVCFEIAQLEARPPAVVVRRGDLIGYALSGGTQDTYAACEVTWLDPATKRVRRARVEAAHARERIVVAADASAPLQLPSRTLRQSATGEDVRQWQVFLVSHGHDTGGIDGIFGPRTRAATMAFQAMHGAAVDGVAGPETYRAAAAAGYGEAATGTRAEVSGRVLRREVRVETQEQAELRARALLLEANRLRVAGTLTLPGDPRLVAGVTLELEDMGRLSGRYLVQQSTHRVSRSGYTTDVEVTCVV